MKYYAQEKKELGKKIKKARIEKKLTQDELGAKIGVEGGAIANYEIGARFPNNDKLCKIAEALEKNLDYFKTNEELLIKGNMNFIDNLFYRKNYTVEKKVNILQEFLLYLYEYNNILNEEIKLILDNSDREFFEIEEYKINELNLEIKNTKLKIKGLKNIIEKLKN